MNNKIITRTIIDKSKGFYINIIIARRDVISA